MSEKKKTFVELSRDDWQPGEKTDPRSMESIQLGCILRIANATEAMAVNHLKLQRELEWYKERYEHYRSQSEQKSHTIRGLKGANTRLKNKLKKLQA